MTDSDRIEPLEGTTSVARNPEKIETASSRHSEGLPDETQTAGEGGEPEASPKPRRSRGRGRSAKTDVASESDVAPVAVAQTPPAKPARTTTRKPRAPRVSADAQEAPLSEIAEAIPMPAASVAPSQMPSDVAFTAPKTLHSRASETLVARTPETPSTRTVETFAARTPETPVARTVETPVSRTSETPASRGAASFVLTMHPVQVPVSVPPAAVPAVRPPVVASMVEEPTADALADEGDAAPSKRRRSRRSGRGRKRAADVAVETAETTEKRTESDVPVVVSVPVVLADKPKSRSRRRKSAAKNGAVVDAALLVAEGAAIPMPAGVPHADGVFEAEREDAAESTFVAVVDSVEVDDETPSTSRKSRSRSRGRKKTLRETPPPLEDTDALDDDDDDEDAHADRIRKPESGEIRKMLVSVLPGDQVEVVLTEENKVCEYYVEMTHQAKIRGNIYKGVINNIDANLQAAFVNYGNVKNGFLQIDEVHPEYYLQPHEPMKGRKYPPMQKVLKAGQEVLVQVVKEPTGNKGAFLTTWVSLAGRFLVLTPGQEQIGISRKVEDGEERNRLRELIKGLEPGEGLGAIVRTVSAGTSKTTLQKDLSFLKRVWKDIRKRATTEKAPSLIYQEPGLASRSVRDYLSDDVTEVWVDDADTAEAIREMAGLLFPRKADLVHLYEDHQKSLWEHFGVARQIEQVQAREVVMPSGGRLVFDQTEALMAIDINSGRIGGKTNFESMAHRTNMEAAVVIAQQLRLRDIGGQIVIDFIEMRDPEHGREVEKALRNAMKGDRARHDIGKMSSFGLLQVVRQRTGSSAISISMEPCPHCKGTGQRRNIEWQAVQALHDLHRDMRLASASGQTECAYAVDAELGLHLLNYKRERLGALEKEYNLRLEIRINGVSPAPVVVQLNGKPA